MKYIKTDTNLGPIYQFQEDNNIFFIYENNYNLYWTLYSKDCIKDNNSFIINNDNESIYNVFDQLYNDFKDINIFEDEANHFYIDDEKDRVKYLKQKGIDNNLRKHNYKLFNRLNYNNLYNEETKTITWNSIDKRYDNLEIKKEDNSFLLNFKNQPNKTDIDYHYISVSFSNTSTNPFNMLFFKMFDNLKEIDNNKIKKISN